MRDLYTWSLPSMTLPEYDSVAILAPDENSAIEDILQYFMDDNCADVLPEKLSRVDQIVKKIDFLAALSDALQNTVPTVTTTLFVPAVTHHESY